MKKLAIILGSFVVLVLFQNCGGFDSAQLDSLETKNVLEPSRSDTTFTPLPEFEPDSTEGKSFQVKISAASVKVGDLIDVEVANLNFSNTTWVALYRAGVSDAELSFEQRWIFLNGTKQAPATKIESANLKLEAPSQPGNYDIRIFAQKGLENRVFMSKPFMVSSSGTTPTPAPVLTPAPTPTPTPLPSIPLPTQEGGVYDRGVFIKHLAKTPYRNVFDSIHATYKNQLLKLFGLNNWSGSYDDPYNAQFMNKAFLDMFIATGDNLYLEEIFKYNELLISKMTLIDRQGRKNWPAPGRGDPNPAFFFPGQIATYQLSELQYMSSALRLVELIKGNPSLNKKYGTRADAIYQIAKVEIFDKWFAHRTHLIGDYAGHAMNRMNLKVNTWGVQDRWAFTAMGALSIGRLEPKATFVSRGVKRNYMEYATQMFAYAAERFLPNSPPGAPGSLSFDARIEAMKDTSHAARFPLLAWAGHSSNLPTFPKTLFPAMALNFQSAVWNGSVSNPLFRNSPNGSSSYGSYGTICYGWEKTGAVDRKAQQAVKATLDFVLAGKVNDSSKFNATPFGKLSLAAGYMYNEAVYSSGAK